MPHREIGTSVRRLVHEKGARSLKVTAYVVTIFFTVVSLFPLFWMFSSSLKDNMSINSYPPRWLPKVPQEVTVNLTYDNAASRDPRSYELDAMKATWFSWKKYQNDPIGAIRVIGRRNHKIIYEAETLSSNFNVARNTIVQSQFFTDLSMRLKLPLIRTKKFSSFVWYGDTGKPYLEDSDIKFIPADVLASTEASAEAAKIKAYLQTASWLSGKVAQTTQKDNYFRFFDNYFALWRLQEYINMTPYGFQHFFGNSLLVTLAVILSHMVFGGMAGYALSALLGKRWSGIWTLFFVATIMIPGVAVLVPQYLITNSLHLTGTIWGIILPYTSWGIVIFLFKGFFDQLPHDLIQAARIDGASELQIYFQMIVPLSLPIFTVVAVMTFLPVWNDLLWPLVASGNNSAVWTFTVFLNKIQDSPLIAGGQNILMACMVVSTLPLLLLFIFCQGMIEKGIAWTGIKG